MKRPTRPLGTFAVLTALMGLGGCATHPSSDDDGDLMRVGGVRLVSHVQGWSVMKLPNMSFEITSNWAESPAGGHHVLSRKAFVLRDDSDRVQALIIVTSNRPAGSSITSNATCTAGGPDLYVNDQAEGMKLQPACVKAAAYLTAETVAGVVPKEVAQAIRDRSLKMYSLNQWVHVYTMGQNGVKVGIDAFLGPRVSGLTGKKPDARVPKTMNADLAAWADALGRAAKKATGSFSGNLELPLADFHLTDSKNWKDPYEPA